MKDERARVYSSEPILGERLIAAFSYLTAGMVGLVWIVLSHINGRTLKPFIRYHATQSVFLSVLYMAAKLALGIILAILNIIPVIGAIVSVIVAYVQVYPLIFGFSIIDFGILLAVIYLVVTSMQGKFTEIPWISDNVKRML